MDRIYVGRTNPNRHDVESTFIHTRTDSWSRGKIDEVDVNAQSDSIAASRNKNREQRAGSGTKPFVDR